jgi:peptide/nickel transport system ATP-binding protein
MPYTVGLVASVPRESQRGRLVAIPGSPPGPEWTAPGCRFAPRCPLADHECRAGPIDPVGVTGDHWARCLHIDRLAALSFAPVPVATHG